MRKPGLIIPAAVVGFAAWGAAAGRAEVVIAVAGPMTGRYASYGAEMRAGAALAVENLNSTGGVGGERVTLKVADDGCDRQTAATAARRLVSENARLIVGHYCESATAAAGAIYASSDVVQIMPAVPATPSAGERAGPNILRLSGRAPDQDEVAARFIAARYAGKRVAILHDRTRYGLAHAGSVRKALAGSVAGAASEPAPVVLFTPIVAGEKDYRSMVAQLRAASVDLVYFGGFHTEAALLVRQMRQAGLKATLFGPDTLVADEFWTLAGAAGEGTLVTHFQDAARAVAAQDTVSRLRMRSVDPSPVALRSYVAVMMWGAGVASAGGHAANAVSQALVSRPQQTILGPVTFNDRGQGDLPTHAVFAWRGGKLAPAE